MEQRLVLRARVESGIPKLLVKINPSEGCAAKNLGEVMLRKVADPMSGVPAHRGHVAVLHMSYSVPPGELVMSLKLAEILDVEEDEKVELTSASSAGASATTSSAPAPTPAASTGQPHEGSTALGGASRRINGVRETSEAAPSVSGWLPKAESKFGAPWPTAASMETPFGGKLPSRAASFDYDWLRSSSLDNDGGAWRQRARESFGTSDRPPGSSPSSMARGLDSFGTGQRPPGSSPGSTTRGLDAFSERPPGSSPTSMSRGLRGSTSSSPIGGTEASRNPMDFSMPSQRSSAGSVTAPTASGIAAAAAANAAAAHPTGPPEWLRDLRAFAEWDVREANRPAAGADLPDLASGLSAGFSGCGLPGGMSDRLSGSPYSREGGLSDRPSGSPYSRESASHGLGTGSLFGGSAVSGSSSMAPGNGQSWRSSHFGSSSPHSFSGVGAADLGSGFSANDHSQGLRSDATAIPRRCSTDGGPSLSDFEFAPPRGDDHGSLHKSSEGIPDDQWPRWPFGWLDGDKSPFAAGLGRSSSPEQKHAHLGATSDPLAETPLGEPPAPLSSELPAGLNSSHAPGYEHGASFDVYSRSTVPSLSRDRERRSSSKGEHPLPDRVPLGPESVRRNSEPWIGEAKAEPTPHWQSRTSMGSKEKVDSLPASDCSEESAKVRGVGKVRPGYTRLSGNPLDAAAGLSAQYPGNLGHADDFHLNRPASETRDSKEDFHNWRDDLNGLSGRHYATAPASSVWDAPTPQRAGHTVTPAAAESLEPSPMHSRAMSRTSSPSVPSRGEGASSRASSEVAPPPLPTQEAKRSVRIESRTFSEASSRAPSSLESPRERSVHTSSTPLTSSPRGSSNTSDPRGSTSTSDQAHMPTPPRPMGKAAAIVPHTEVKGAGKAGGGPRRQSGLLSRRKTRAFGFLETEEKPSPSKEDEKEVRRPVSTRWRAPNDTSGGGLERSELGSEVTVEIRQWLLGETSGPQCSQVVLDRALTVLANFKLASGCQLEVLGGPLGAIVGGYSDADWLHDEVFRKQPSDAIREAFMLLGFRGRADGDWSNIAAEEVSLAYRRLCLRGHPSRGGDPRGYLKLQVAMELIRAFAGEAGPLDLRTPRAKERTPTSTPSERETPSSRLNRRFSSKDLVDGGFVLNDITLVRELQLTAAQAEEEAREIPQETLEEMNRALDEYILRQMCFKSEIVDEIARLHEDCAYAILGVSSDATDSEIKKAYRLIAMQCHPDKGGDKEDFQELNNAYEKIMEQRRSSIDPGVKGGPHDAENDDQSDMEDLLSSKKKKKDSDADKSSSKAEKDEDDVEAAEEEGDRSSEKATENAGAEAEEEYGEEGSNASLVEKAGKAAEEASRYAKTAAEFAHQAAEAAETARRGREQGSRDTLTKSIAHSAIVLTLTVVKAVRVVGYATLDVAAQCRIAAKRIPSAVGCSERAVSAMSLGLEALNAALACAEVTETTAAELQAPVSAAEGDAAGAASGATAAAERFVGAAVRASLAAASASNAAMSAAIAAVEGSRECMKAVEAQAANAASNAEDDEDSRSGDAAGELSEEDAALRAKLEAMSANELKEQAQEAGATAEELDEIDDADDPTAAMIDLIMKHRAAQAGPTEKPERKSVPPPPTAEEAALAATKRLVAQRNNNHKVLQRLNSEILGHQQNVRQFLQANRQLIPEVSGEAKKKVFRLLQDYSSEARAELDGFISAAEDAGNSQWEELLQAIREQPLLAPFAQEQAVAIPVSVKARVLKMASLYDLEMTMQVLDQEIFTPVRSVVSKADQESRQKADKILARIQEELKSHMREAE